jgi:hypothetical protein
VAGASGSELNEAPFSYSRLVPDERSSIIADLGRRLQALEDRQAILDTLHRYGHALDYGLEDEFLDCFTDDAVWDTEPMTPAVRAEQLRVGRLPANHVGRDELQAFVQRHSRAPQRWHKHLVVGPLIEIHGVEAQVTSYFLRVDANRSDTGAHIRASGRYRDRFVRCDDGCWRIAARLAETEAFVALD